jgi:hypothetical protein
MGIPKFLIKVDAILLLQAFCHLDFAIWQGQRHTAVLQGSKKLRMHMKVPFITTLFPTLWPLLTAGKNIVRYFLDRPCMYKELSYAHLVLICLFEALFFRSFLNSLLLLEMEFQKYLAQQLKTCKKLVFLP